MSAARAAHTATALPDGRVLVVGGFVEKGSARGAEAYTAGAGRFSALPPMVTTRHSHTATTLPGGKVLDRRGMAKPSRSIVRRKTCSRRPSTFARLPPPPMLRGQDVRHVRSTVLHAASLPQGAHPRGMTIASVRAVTTHTNAILAFHFASLKNMSRRRRCLEGGAIEQDEAVLLGAQHAVLAPAAHDPDRGLDRGAGQVRELLTTQ